jgi:hypothetical protein
VNTDNGRTRAHTHTQRERERDMILLSFLAIFLAWGLQDTDRNQADVANDVGPAVAFGLTIYASCAS